MKENMIVMKFGGASLANLGLVTAVAEYLRNCLENFPGIKIVAVVSAMGKYTDNVEQDLKKLAPGLYSDRRSNPNFSREADSGMQAGEVISAAYLAAGLLEIGVKAISLNAHQLQILTSGGYQDAKIKEISGIDRLKQELESHDVAVITGFQGIHEAETDAIATLGRGGSDTAAVALAARLGCKCVFYKASGIVTAFDPKLGSAKALEFITYADAKTLAEYGYMFLHPRCLEIAQRNSVPLEFRASPGMGNNPDMPGTTIGERLEFIEHAGDRFQAIAVKSGIMFITINGVPNSPGWSEKIFGLCREISLLDFQQISIGRDGKFSAINFVIAEAEYRKHGDLFVSRIGALGPKVFTTRKDALGCLTLIDSAMLEGSGFGYRIGKALADAKINIAGQITSGNKVHTYIHQAALEKGVIALAKAFELLAE
jgi:aspartate kinase